ncbi:MAG: Spy/CpxP family protein refolding chaperone [Pseudolabrys sp.]|nr:Spy/CpxP family protein refolding chaperone [Pseudolabrys sp.]
MLKSVLAGTTALAIAGATFAYAQQPPRGPRGDHWRPSAEDISAFTDARIAGLKAGLKLTAEQEKNWPAVETALRDLAKQRAERAQARAAGPKGDAKPGDKAGEPKRDPIERLRQRADRMTESGTALKKLADAAAPLYQSLDEGQKHRFMMLARIGMRGMDRGMERRGWHHGRHHGGPGWRHHGPRGMGGDMGPGMGPDGGPAGGPGGSQRL